MGVFRLESRIQAYDWGSKTAISEALGREPSGEPEAEMWMGAHPRCPSPLVGDAAVDLEQLIALDRDGHLGEQASAEFGGLPYLFKVLAAERPLSLQAHPSSAQAKAGFSLENEQGVPLDAPHRSYKDAGHKPELILALSDFTALSGFREPKEAYQASRDFFTETEGPIAGLLDAFMVERSNAGLAAYFRGLFSVEKSALEASIAAAVKRVQAGEVPARAAAMAPWFLRLAGRYPADPGVMASVLLHVLTLTAGEAMFLPAGNLHAYLDGLGLEIMASSDNVLRGGLTSKHVDVGELCRVLKFEALQPEVQQGRLETRGQISVRRFVTPAPEFELSLVDVAGPSESWVAQGPEIWLGLADEVVLQLEGESVVLGRGQQIFVSAGTHYGLQGAGQAARAALPGS